MFPRSSIRGTMGHSTSLWPVTLVLAIGVLLPTACVLWFMNEAIRNERLIARQQIQEAYRASLTVARERLAEHWDQTAQRLQDLAAAPNPAAAFEQAIRENLADSLVLLDRSGRPLYPNPRDVRPPSSRPNSEPWRQAAALEDRQDFQAATEAYAAIARAAANPNEHAQAIQAQARTLLRSGRRSQIVPLIRTEFASPMLARAADPQGRLIAADLELMALEIAPTDAALRDRLTRRLGDYANPALGSSQRLFLMNRLHDLGVAHPMLAAEQLAARWIDRALDATALHAAALRPAGLDGIWQMATPDGRLIALYREPALQARLTAAIKSQAIPVRIWMPADTPPAAAHAIEIGAALPGWKLSLYQLEAPSAETPQTGLYLTIAAMVIASLLAITLLMGWVIRRQMRLARLKNDLVSTVSHELKTPLSSMRLLVDTLLDSNRWDQQQAREYLELIARENNRLSHLIENFLQFSRMERGRYAFDFHTVTAERILDDAVQALGERLTNDGCRFESRVEPGLPPLRADAGALVTVLINLLDNALKYSSGERHIELSAFAENGEVCFSVRDNGIGLTPKQRKRVFERFYQADQSLSRAAGGCGLGLSIVDFIVRAHHGSIAVDSILGRGSTFTVRIPAAPRPAAAEQALALKDLP